MKLNKYILSVLGGAMIAGATVSCTDDFESINTDPNNMPVGEINPYGLFEATLYGMANREMYLTWSYNGELVQYTACTGSNGKDLHRYSVNNNNVETVWQNYAKWAANADHIMKVANTKGDDAIEAVATTIKVFAMSNLTDIFGDIPYAEAFKYEELNWTPKFDSQQEVYEQMLADLEAANKIYQNSPAFEEPSIDIMYGGDMKKWQKFNNSLWLRLLMRVSGRAEMNAGTAIAKILKTPAKFPVFESNADNAQVNFTGVDPYYNYFDYNKTTHISFSKGSYKLTHTLIDLMLKTGKGSEEDPRLAVIGYRAQVDGDWEGVQGGCSLSDQRVEDAGASYMNYPVLAYNDGSDTDFKSLPQHDCPAFLMEYSEVQFILAEAALKGLIDGGDDVARSYYEKAVTANMKKWADYTKYCKRSCYISDNSITEFLNGDLGGWDNWDDHAALIANQKYLSLFWVGMQAYHELRRTGWPVITMGRGCSYNNFEYPQRLYYPTNTVGSNSTHVQEALDRMGGENNLRTSVWWSYKAINGTFTAVRQ